MIKNAILYRLSPEFAAGMNSKMYDLDSFAFAPCGATQEHSAGFVPPRGEANGALVESIGGHRILKLMTETKAVPGDLVKRKAAEQAKLIEDTTGRKPGRKEMKEIREDALMSLLPMAFPKQSAHLIWIDPFAGTLVIDASSQSKADTVVTALVQAVPDIGLQMLQTASSPQACMAQWLMADASYDLPEHISIERGCELRSNDEEKSVVKFTRHNLVNEEVHQHIQQGKLPVKLALSWDGRVSFVLTDSLQIKSIEFLEGVYQGGKSNSVDGFDADVAIMTGELSKLIADLSDALGGESAVAQPAAKASTPDHPITDAEDDPLYDPAVAIVRQHDKASISLVQRHLMIGYNRADRMIERMEKDGIVSPMDMSGSRTVLKG